MTTPTIPYVRLAVNPLTMRTAKNTYVYLLSFCTSERPTCYMTLTKWLDDLKISKATLWRHLRRLEAEGAIVVTERVGFVPSFAPILKQDCRRKCAKNETDASTISDSEKATATEVTPASTPPPTPTPPDPPVVVSSSTSEEEDVKAFAAWIVEAEPLAQESVTPEPAAVSPKPAPKAAPDADLLAALTAYKVSPAAALTLAQNPDECRFQLDRLKRDLARGVEIDNPGGWLTAAIRRRDGHGQEKPPTVVAVGGGEVWRKPIVGEVAQPDDAAYLAYRERRARTFASQPSASA